MSKKQLVKISNAIGIIAIILLMYWTFSFVLMEVLGLKVFRKNITEKFYMSVLGILALMTGALMINIMFNLTIIAQNKDRDTNKPLNKKIIFFLLSIFPLIALLLYMGDYYTRQKKENLLIHSAESLIQQNTPQAEKMLNYTFDDNYINETSSILGLLTKSDTNFPEVSLIKNDTINNAHIYLSFNSYSSENTKDSIPPNKMNYIRKTTQEEREYLQSVFSKKNNKVRYTSSDGNYELFYPYIKNNKVAVLYFSDYQKYGK